MQHQSWIHAADAILDSIPTPADVGTVIGHSREGRPVTAIQFGHGPIRVSLIAGCHADEPVGPRFLRHFVAYLSALDANHPLLRQFSWWIIPHANPDGERRNHAWYSDSDDEFDPLLFLEHHTREAPGDDMEFGFPHGPDDSGARPENRAIYEWWRAVELPFHLHATLHGCATAGGPWFLIEKSWWPRCGELAAACTGAVVAMNYRLHDVDRRGEKGFHRLAKGFCSRPDSAAMKDYFLAHGDTNTAAKFRPSSMETVRGFGGDPLCLVPEIPLFVTPGVGEILGPPDPAAVRWKATIESWQNGLRQGRDHAHIRREIAASGLRPVPVRDQMRLQWIFIASGLDTICQHLLG